MLTLLRTDGQPGLQIAPDGARWVDVPPLPGSFIVNLGDMLCRRGREEGEQLLLVAPLWPRGGGTPAPRRLHAPPLRSPSAAGGPTACTAPRCTGW